MSDIETRQVGRVLVATMNRAAHQGSIGGQVMAGLLDAARTVHTDAGLGALVVAADGPVWSSGGDPNALNSGFGPGARASHLVHREKIGGENGIGFMSDQAIEFDVLGIGAWLPLYRQCDKPLIAAIDGAAVGGGFALALAHDYRIVTDNARFLPAFNGLGVGPELGTSWTLSRLVGISRAAEIIMSNAWVGAERALEQGMANMMVPSEDLLDRAIEVATEIAARPPHEVIGAVRALREASSRSLEQQLALEWDARR